MVDGGMRSEKILWFGDDLTIEKFLILILWLLRTPSGFGVIRWRRGAPFSQERLKYVNFLLHPTRLSSPFVPATDFLCMESWTFPERLWITRSSKVDESSRQKRRKFLQATRLCLWWLKVQGYIAWEDGIKSLQRVSEVIPHKSVLVGLKFACITPLTMGRICCLPAQIISHFARETHLLLIRVMNISGNVHESHYWNLAPLQSEWWG